MAHALRERLGGEQGQQRDRQRDQRQAQHAAFAAGHLQQAIDRGRDRLRFADAYPNLGDWVTSTPFDPHYFYQGKR